MPYKIPFREVHCYSIKDWFKEMIWIFLVIKIFPNCHNFNSDPFASQYVEDIRGRELFYQQYNSFLVEASEYIRNRVEKFKIEEEKFREKTYKKKKLKNNKTDFMNK